MFNPISMMMLKKQFTMKIFHKKRRKPIKQNSMRKKKLSDLITCTDSNNLVVQLTSMKFRVSFMVDFHQDSGCTENICAALTTNIFKETHTRENSEMENQSCHFIHGSVSLLIMEADKWIL